MTTDSGRLRSAVPSGSSHVSLSRPKAAAAIAKKKRAMWQFIGFEPIPYCWLWML
jgi:hypothetical protein